MAVARNWYIWYDRRPGDEPDNILRITAECEFATSGHAVVLEPHDPDTGDGTELAFELVVISGDIVVFVPEILNISEEIPTDGRVESVRILDEGEWFTLAVHEPG